MAATWSRPLRAYLALLGLTLLSLLLWALPLGAASLGILLAVAAAQAAISLLVFMHLGEARFTTVLVPFAVVFFVGLLLSLTALDVATRTTFPRAPSPSVPDPTEELR